MMRGHVPDEKLDEYRELKKALDTLDAVNAWYLIKQRNAPLELGRAIGEVYSAMINLRVPISK